MFDALALLLAAGSSGCWATDGDTIRCGEERIRLIGIDAPELSGHCRPGRRCVQGDGEAAKATLEWAMQLGPISLRRVGTDAYDRTLAVVYAGDVNLSCAMLENGQAVYIERWDNGGLIAADCPHAAR